MTTPPDADAPASRLLRQARHPRAACVFCGASPGARPEFAEAARRLGALLADNAMPLVYGGGNLGLMGEIARSTLDDGGHVTGIMPQFLIRRERLLEGVSETIIVPDMHTRKRLMYERASAFIALPGGVGTLEELIEQMTWAQLGQHSRPIVLLNTLGFWRPLLDLLGHMRENQFLRPDLDVAFQIADTPENAITALLAGMARVQAAQDADVSYDPERPAAPGPF